ncbi:MAG: restriction endonuclease subunit S [Trichlorobacter sp.]|uniref:restriction endonuclease subunit S n=1 Tax=Trichlorobacter sp. TaxID=2911007 RepID=UPI00256A6904|nr:restriction endonuclease subunit S [Trichlorobacter sp.]MDK9718414.1 restriction endonuclease subunit S [Trichlorobacter sp.]
MTVSLVRLGDVAAFIRGITFKPEDKIEPNSTDAVVCMRTKNVQDILDQDDLIAIPQPFVKRKEQYLFEGDLLVSTANSWELVGKSCWVPKLSYQATAGGFISILRSDREKIFPRYLYHWMNSSETLHQLRYCGRQTTNISNMSLDLACDLELPLPPLLEQKRIAAILDKADAIRRKRQQAVKLTEELLRSVFLDMFGDPVTNPKGWEVKSLAEEITFMTSGSRGWAEYYSDHGSKFIRIQNVKNGQLHFNDVQYVKAPDNKEAARTKVQENDLLISITADLGRTAVVDKQTADEGAHINQHLALVRLSNAINPHFVAAYLESQGGKSQFLQLDQSAVKSGLNFDSIKSLHLYNPPFVLQKQYAAAVESVENTKVKLKDAADTSDTLFTSLLQRAFRGELS